MSDASLRDAGAWPPARVYPAPAVDDFVAEANRTIEDLRSQLERMTVRASLAERRLENCARMEATVEHAIRSARDLAEAAYAESMRAAALIGLDHNGSTRRVSYDGAIPVRGETVPAAGVDRRELDTVAGLEGPMPVDDADLHPLADELALESRMRSFWRRGGPLELRFEHLRDGPLGNDAAFIAALQPTDDPASGAPLAVHPSLAGGRPPASIEARPQLRVVDRFGA